MPRFELCARLLIVCSLLLSSLPVSLVSASSSSYPQPQADPPTETPVPTETVAVTATETGLPTETVVITPTETIAPAATATSLVTTTATLTPTAPPPTLSPTATLTPTLPATASPTPWPSATDTPAVTVTATLPATLTPSPTVSATLTPTPLVSPTLTPSPALTPPLPLSLALSMQAQPAFAQPGSAVTVTMRVTNSHQITVENLTISTTLPAALSYDTAAGPVVPGYNPLRRLLTWPIPPALSRQAVLTVGYVARLDETASPSALNLVAEISQPPEVTANQAQTSLIIAPAASTPAPVRPQAFPAGPPVRIQLGLKSLAAGPNQAGGWTHWLAAQVVDVDGLAVADDTVVTFELPGGTLEQPSVRTRAGLALIRVALPPGQPVSLTATAGGVQATLSDADAVEELDLSLALHRPDRQYGAEREAVLRARNAVQAEGDALVAENRSRRVSFGPDGLNFELKLFDDPTGSATVKGAPPRERLSLGFDLTDIRIGSTSLVTGQSDPTAGGNWVRYQAADQSWQMVYEVGEGVVEQYFVFETPPPDQGDLVIAGRFRTSLQPVYLSAEAGLRFETGGSPAEPEVALGYGPAVVEDARGRRLTAQMELKGKDLRLTIPAGWLAGAEFPIVVDPVIGPAELVSTLQGDANQPRIAFDGTNFLTVWEWNGDIYGQRLDSNGDHVGDLIVISQAEDVQQQAEVAYNPVSDEYLVTWVDRRYGYQYRALYTQRIAPGTGALLGSEVEVRPPSSYLGYLSGTRTAVSEAGDYLLVWANQRSGSGYDVFGQMIAPSGVLTGSLIELSGATPDYQRYPGVAYDDQADTFLATWADQRDGSGYDLYGQRLDAQGALVGSNQLLVDAGGLDVEKTMVASTDTDQFLVVWEHELSSSDTDILGLRMTASSGSVLSGTIEIDTSGGNDADPAVVPLSASEYLVVWAENGYKLSTRRVGSDGSLPGTALLDFVRGYVPAVTYDGSQALAVWEDYLTAGQTLISGQRLSTGDTTIGNPIYVSPYYTAREHVSLAYQAAANRYLGSWDQAETGPGEDVFVQHRWAGPADGPTGEGDEPARGDPAKGDCGGRSKRLFGRLGRLSQQWDDRRGYLCSTAGSKRAPVRDRNQPGPNHRRAVGAACGLQQPAARVSGGLGRLPQQQQ